MKTIIFDERFSEAIKSGNKKGTFRRTDKGLREGDRVVLKTTKGEELLDVMVIDISPAILDFKANTVSIRFFEDAPFKNYYTESTAKSDGFESWQEMGEFFKEIYGSHEFTGYLIIWKNCN